MNATTSSGRAWIPTAAIAVGYVVLALLQGGYATTTVAWSAIAVWGAVGIVVALRPSSGVAAPRAAIAAAACFAGLAAFSVLSMAWADDAGRAFEAALLPGAYAGLLVLVVVAAPRAGGRTWLRGIAVGGTAITLLALASRLDPGFLGTNDQASGALAIGAEGRLSYPIGYWNGLAACIAVSLALLVWLGSDAPRRGVRTLCVALLPLGGLALFFTSSRGGVLAVAVGVAVLGALGPRRPALLAGAALGLAGTVPLVLIARGRHDLINDLGTSTERHQGLELAAIALGIAALIGVVRWAADPVLQGAELQLGRRARRWAAVGLVVAVVAGVAASNPDAGLRSFVHDSPTTAVPGQRSLFSASGSGRAQFWHAALNAFTSHPLGGVGAGNYELYWNAHPEAPVVTGNAHSLFLQALADLGALGLILALGPFALAVGAGLTRWRRVGVAPALAVLAAATVGAAIDWTWMIPAAFGTAVVAMALLAGPATAPPYPAPAQVRNFRAPRGFGWGVATLLFGWGIAWIAGIVLFASFKLDASRAAVGGADLEAAASDARAAATVEPFSPEPQIQLAQIYELARQPGQARAAARRAIDNAPGDWRGWALASRIDRRRGQANAAAAEQAQARALVPVRLPPEFRPRR